MSLFSDAEVRTRFELARLAFIASLGGSEEVAEAKAQMAEDVPSTRGDWTYALAWALFKTEVAPTPEPETIGWPDVRVGDEITLMVFAIQEGLVRERRKVVSVDWPKIVLAEGDRVYEIDATASDTMNRSIRRAAT